MNYIKNLLLTFATFLFPTCCNNTVAHDNVHKEVKIDQVDLFQRQVRMIEAQSWNNLMNSFYTMWTHYGLEFEVFPFDDGIGEYKYKEAFKKQVKRLEEEMIKKDEA